MTGQTKGILFASTTALLWGFLAVALEMSLNVLDAATIVWFRFSFSFLALFLLLFKKRGRLSRLSEIPLLSILSGIFLGINYFSFLKGVSYTSPSNVQIIIQCGPLLLALSGFLLFKESLSRIQIIGYGLAMLGFILFYREQITFLSQGDQNYNTGVMWILLAALSWALYAILQKIIGRKYSPQNSNLVIYFVAAMMFAPLANFSALSELSLTWWPLIIFLGLNTLVAYGCLAEAFSLIPANIISIIITLNPLITLAIMKLLGAFNYSHIRIERVELLGLTGALLVISGATLVVGRIGKKSKRLKAQEA